MVPFKGNREALPLSGSFSLSSCHFCYRVGLASCCFSAKKQNKPSGVDSWIQINSSQVYWNVLGNATRNSLMHQAGSTSLQGPDLCVSSNTICLLRKFWRLPNNSSKFPKTTSTLSRNSLDSPSIPSSWSPQKLLLSSMKEQLLFSSLEHLHRLHLFSFSSNWLWLWLHTNTHKHRDKIKTVLQLSLRTPDISVTRPRVEIRGLPYPHSCCISHTLSHTNSILPDSCSQLSSLSNVLLYFGLWSTKKAQQ